MLAKGPVLQACKLTSKLRGALDSLLDWWNLSHFMIKLPSFPWCLTYEERRCSHMGSAKKHINTAWFDWDQYIKFFSCVALLLENIDFSKQIKFQQVALCRTYTAWKFLRKRRYSGSKHMCSSLEPSREQDGAKALHVSALWVRWHVIVSHCMQFPIAS